jgi:hypothetical protein
VAVERVEGDRPSTLLERGGDGGGYCYFTLLLRRHDVGSRGDAAYLIMLPNECVVEVVCYVERSEISVASKAKREMKMSCGQPDRNGGFDLKILK